MFLSNLLVLPNSFVLIYENFYLKQKSLQNLNVFSTYLSCFKGILGKERRVLKRVIIIERNHSMQTMLTTRL